MPTVFVTAPSDVAPNLARTLVEERLAACCNRVGCRSTYRWDGEVVDNEEVILLYKTTDAGYEPLAERVRELHPYDVPCIERFDPSAVDDAYASWMTESVE